MAGTPPFDILFSVQDLPPLVFVRLDPTSLAIAALVCKKWRGVALALIGPKQHFRFVLASMLARPAVLEWALGPKDEKLMRCLPSWRTKACKLAAEHGHLAGLQWVRENDCPWDDFVVYERAAARNHLEVLQWAWINGCEWTQAVSDEIAINAARNENLEILQWAHANNVPLDQKVCTYAAFYGCFEILKWAREKGYPWDEHTCLNAAARGPLEILRWARNDGCPWNREECLFCAEQNGRDDVVAWIQALAD